MKRVLLFTTFSLLLMYQVTAQLGGRYSYEFLGLPPSARLTALGNGLISVQDSDVSLASTNPASLNRLVDGQVSFNYDFLFDGINNGYLAYGHHFDSLDITGHIAVNYANYGTFTAADEYGNKEGTFKGKETSIIIGAGKSLHEKINVGVNLKAVFGNMEQYNSMGAAVDIGMIYALDQYTHMGLAVKNVGLVLSAYGEETAYAPLDIQVGISKRLKFMPFRYAITAHQLQEWGAIYDDPEVEENNTITGETIERSALSREVDNLFRHLIFSGEFLIGKGESFKLRVGYNHLRRQELTMGEFRSLAGFSGGFGISIKGFKLDYGLGYHHLAGASNHLSISTDLSRFY